MLNGSRRSTAADTPSTRTPRQKRIGCSAARSGKPAVDVRPMKTKDVLHRHLGDVGIRANGMSGQKTRYTVGLVAAALSGDLNMDALTEAEDHIIREKLTSYKGIGPWTADIYLMFGLGRPDVWPSGDLGLQAG